MAQDNRIRMPSSMAGLTSFSEEYKSRLMIPPTGVIIYIAVIVVLVLALRLFA